MRAIEDPTKENVVSVRGAPMGRLEGAELKPASRVRLFRVCLDSGGYDVGGAYWGVGPPSLYCATDGADYCEYTRASDRDCAMRRLGLQPMQLMRR